MGNQQKQQSILDLWNSHCIQKSKSPKQHEEFQKQSPEIVRKNAILVLEQAVHQNQLQSYKEDLRNFLQQMNPQKYAGQLAISVYLNHTQATEFIIPQVNNLKEELIYKSIADYHLIKDLVNIWSAIFSEKYSLFQKEKSQLIKIIESKEYVYTSLCNDIIYFINYLEQMLISIYEVENMEKFKQLLIKMIISNKNVKEIVFDIFQIYSSEKAEIFKQKIQNYKNITLDMLNVPKIYHSEFKITINQLHEILEVEHPCDKFDLFSKLESTMIKDLINTGGLREIQLELDNQIGIIIYCIVKTQSSKWICQLNFIEMFLGQEIQYNQGKKSIQYTNVLSAIEYIMSNF